MAENEPAPTGEPKQEPKIIVDDDWKSQAQAEKEKLARKVEATAAAGGADADEVGDASEAAEAGEGGPRELPPASFATLVSSIVTQAFMSLGGYEDPRTKKRYVDLDLAKHHIDTLGVIEAKTKGNLTDEEKQLLDQAVYECRMQYVNMAQRLSPPPGS